MTSPFAILLLRLSWLCCVRDLPPLAPRARLVIIDSTSPKLASLGWPAVLRLSHFHRPTDRFPLVEVTLHERSRARPAPVKLSPSKARTVRREGSWRGEGGEELKIRIFQLVLSAGTSFIQTRNFRLATSKPIAARERVIMCASYRNELTFFFFFSLFFSRPVTGKRTMVSCFLSQSAARVSKAGILAGRFFSFHRFSRPTQLKLSRRGRSLPRRYEGLARQGFNN